MNSCAFKCSAICSQHNKNCEHMRVYHTMHHISGLRITSNRIRRLEWRSSHTRTEWSAACPFFEPTKNLPEPYKMKPRKNGHKNIEKSEEKPNFEY